MLTSVDISATQQIYMNTVASLTFWWLCYLISSINQTYAAFSGTLKKYKGHDILGYESGLCATPIELLVVGLVFSQYNRGYLHFFFILQTTHYFHDLFQTTEKYTTYCVPEERAEKRAIKHWLVQSLFGPLPYNWSVTELITLVLLNSPVLQWSSS